MRFSEPQRMCEQLLLFAVFFFLFFGVPFFSFFFAFFWCCCFSFVCLFVFVSVFLFHCAFLVCVCFVVASSPSLSSSRIHINLICPNVISLCKASLLCPSCFLNPLLYIFADSIYDINDIYNDSTYVQASLWICFIWPFHMRRLEWASENLRQQKTTNNTTLYHKEDLGWYKLVYESILLKMIHQKFQISAKLITGGALCSVPFECFLILLKGP